MEYNKEKYIVNATVKFTVGETTRKKSSSELFDEKCENINIVWLETQNINIPI